MIESIFLDILLVVVVLLLAAIGAYRGGLREAFSAAGVVLGVLLANEWTETWGGWLARNTNLSDGGSRFVVSVVLLLLATGLVGYGVGASFNYHPGPGGRMFGAGIAAASALISIAYVMTWLRTYLFEGERPAVVANTWIAGILDGDAGLLLLAVSVAILFAAVFGSIVRERDDDMVEAGTAPSFGARRRVSYGPGAPDKVEPPDTGRHPTAPVRVQQSRQWEDRAGEMPNAADRQWSNTWPSDAPGIQQEERPSRPSDVQQARNRRRTQRSDNTDANDGKRRSR